MATWKQKKRPKPPTREQLLEIEQRLNVCKKWKKAFKGEVIFKREGSAQECVLKKGYDTKEELLEDANKVVEEMNALDAHHQWKLVSAKLVGQALDNEGKDV